MFPVLPPLGGVRLLGRAAVTAVNHNNVISRSYWSGEERAGHTVRHAETLGEILSSSRAGEYLSSDCLTLILTDIVIQMSKKITFPDPKLSE